MRSIFLAQWGKDRRNPLLIILFIILSILATLIFASGIESPVMVGMFSEEENGAELEAKWEKLLNEADPDIRFRIMDPEQARTQVRSGQSDVAIKIMDNDYRLIVASSLPTIQQVDQVVRKVFTQQLQIEAMMAGSAGADGVSDGTVGADGLVDVEGSVASFASEVETFRQSVHDYMDEAPFQMETVAVDGNAMVEYNIGTQLMFAFTLFIVMFTIGFKVNGVTNDKASGIWDRLIISPVSKTSVYLGYISYSFCYAFLQVFVTFLLFKYVLHFDLGDQFGLIILVVAIFVLSMISLAMIVTGIIRRPEQFYAIYPSVIPLIPLISGAYMPPGMMDNRILTIVADIFPLSHAMDAMLSIVNDGAGLAEIAVPLSIMLLIGVVYMGVGINLVERRGRA